MTKTTIAVVLAWGLAIAVTARAQTAGDVPPAAAATPPAAPAAGVVLPGAPPPVPATIPIGTRVGMPPSNYEDGSRRDPFTSLVAVRVTASTRPAGSRNAAALPDLVLADVTVRGVVKSGASILAILEGPNRKSFVARPNDKLRDASVQSIDTTGVVFSEQPGPGTRPTSVRKTIRPAGEDIQ